MSGFSILKLLQGIDLQRWIEKEPLSTGARYQRSGFAPKRGARAARRKRIRAAKMSRRRNRRV